MVTFFLQNAWPLLPLNLGSSLVAALVSNGDLQNLVSNLRPWPGRSCVRLDRSNSSCLGASSTPPLGPPGPPPPPRPPPGAPGAPPAAPGTPPWRRQYSLQGSVAPVGPPEGCGPVGDPVAGAPVQGLSAGARAGCCSGAERAWHGGADAVAPPGHVAGHRQMPASTRCTSSRMAWCKVLLVHVIRCSVSDWLA